MSNGMIQSAFDNDPQSVRVGLIHSLSGTMAISEQPLLEAELMAIDEINKTGGILGRQIEPITMDGASTPETFAQKAQELLSSGVKFLFGCWTSASRKAVKLIVEDADGLLWYPVQYEGLEESAHIVYTGSCPVQQIVPAVEWVLAHIGSRIFLVGSDYVYPRTANNLIRSRVETIVGERYVPQGGMDFASIIEEIQRQKPDVVFSTVFGESNLAFYRQYHAAGIDAQSIPIMAVCVSETELQPIADLAAGHYVCRNYFQSVNRPENQRFVANYKKRCGEAAVCSAPMATAYAQIYLWKLAVEAAGSFDAAQVRSHVVGCEFLGPAGTIVIESNHHTSMCAFIGRGTPHGQFEVLDSTAGIRPWPWLGIENSKLLYKTAIKEAMAAYPEVQNALVELALADKGFRETSRLNTLLLENMLDVVAQTDLVGTCEYASPSMKSVLGYDPKDMLGKSMFEYVHPDDFDNVFEIVRKALVAGTTEKFEYRYRHADGHYVWLESGGNPLFDEKGQMTGAVLSSRDITERKKAEDAVRLSEAKYRTLVENATDFIFLVGEKDEVISINPAATRLLGKTVEQVLGKSLSDVYPKEIATMFSENVRAVLQTGKSKTIDEKIVLAGNELWINTRLEPLLDDRGRAYAVIGVARDITERKRMEQELEQNSQLLECLVEERARELVLSKEKYRHIYETSMNTLFTTSIEGEILEMNPAGLSLFGFSSLDEAKKTNIKTMYVDSEDRKRLIQFANSGPVRDFETRFKRRDGRVVETVGNTFPVKDEKNRIVELQGAIIDITERNRMEKMRDEFLSDATDELLTPLTSIKGYLDNVLTENKPLPGKVTSDLQVIQRNVDRLHEIVNDLLDIRQMGVGRVGRIPLNLEPLDLRQILEHCVAEAKPVSSQKHSFHLEIPERPLSINGDRVKLSLVVDSLLNNAVKFTPQGGEIIIRASKEADMIKVRVSDMGIGIKQADLGRVLEVFPAIQKSSYVKGRGLGLSIAKGLVEAHGGRIWAESAGEGQGATFTFTLPERKEAN